MRYSCTGERCLSGDPSTLLQDAVYGQHGDSWCQLLRATWGCAVVSRDDDLFVLRSRREWRFRLRNIPVQCQYFAKWSPEAYKKERMGGDGHSIYTIVNAQLLPPSAWKESVWKCFLCIYGILSRNPIVASLSDWVGRSLLHYQS